jgi:MarR family transcriptional regulator, organic hydroperoxide resistance regulator
MLGLFSKATADEELFLSLMGAYTLAAKGVEKALRPANLTVAEYALLRVVENRPGVTAAQAGQRLFATAPSIAQLVRKLEDKKMLARDRDAADARKMHLALTGEGKAAVKAGRKGAQAFLRSLDLPDGLLSSLGADLSTLLASLSPYADRTNRSDA